MSRNLEWPPSYYKKENVQHLEFHEGLLGKRLGIWNWLHQAPNPKSLFEVTEWRSLLYMLSAKQDWTLRYHDWAESQLTPYKLWYQLPLDGNCHQR